MRRKLHKNTRGGAGKYMLHSHETAPKMEPHTHMQMKGPYMQRVLQYCSVYEPSVANKHVQRPYSGATVAIHAMGLWNAVKAGAENKRHGCDEQERGSKGAEGGANNVELGIGRLLGCITAPRGPVDAHAVMMLMLRNAGCC